MPQLLVAQLRFARSELQRCLAGVSEDDATRRLGPLNCLSWIVGHLANQEHNYWLRRAQGRNIVPDLNALVGFGQPASTPPLAAMWQTWYAVTAAADEYLDQLDEPALHTFLEYEGQRAAENVGTMLLRNIYHYWFHIGEAHAIRQSLGHRDLPEFVGPMSAARY